MNGGKERPLRCGIAPKLEQGRKWKGSGKKTRGQEGTRRFVESSECAIGFRDRGGGENGTVSRSCSESLTTNTREEPQENLTWGAQQNARGEGKSLTAEQTLLGGGKKVNQQLEQRKGGIKKQPTITGVLTRKNGGTANLKGGPGNLRELKDYLFPQEERNREPWDKGIKSQDC